jgi:GNAT superfamily N-acetyltransferase/predicted GNAT family N-acyltransferase
MDIRLVDPADAPSMRRFHEIGWRAEKEDGRPWNAFWTLSEMTAVMSEPTDDARLDGVALFEGDRMVAGGVVHLSLLGNVDKAWLFPAVEPELRGRGLGSALLQGLVDHAREHGRTEMLGGTSIPFAERESSSVLRFAEKHGFRVANSEVCRSLPLPVDEGLLAQIRAESEPFHDGYSIETYVDELPDRYLESYAHLRNQLALDAPTGELEFEEEHTSPDTERQKLERNKRSGRTTYLSLAVKDDEAVAHSDLVVPPEGTQAMQMGTLVQRDHRGHRLGAAVKVANLAALQRDRPDLAEVHTQNAETNQHMVSINERLGFAPVGWFPEFLREL